MSNLPFIRIQSNNQKFKNVEHIKHKIELNELSNKLKLHSHFFHFFLFKKKKYFNSSVCKNYESNTHSLDHLRKWNKPKPKTHLTLIWPVQLQLLHDSKYGSNDPKSVANQCCTSTHRTTIPTWTTMGMNRIYLWARPPPNIGLLFTTYWMWIYRR